MTDSAHHDARPLRSSAVLAGSVLLLYALLAIGATWPLATRTGSVVPVGTDRSDTVPLASAWALWWTSDRIGAGFAGFWDAPIFHNVENTFAFSEPMLLEGVATAPLFWMGASAPRALNLMLLTALATNGALAFGLLRALHCRALAALAGGAMMVLLPAVHHELGVPTLVPLAGLLGTLWALIAFGRAPTPLRGAGVGLAVAATYLLCGQYGVYLALVIAPSSLWLLRRSLFQPRAGLGALAGIALCAALLTPVALAQLDMRRTHHFARHEGAVRAGAASTGAWRRTPWRQPVPAPGISTAEQPWQQAHFPGTIKVVLALAGLASGLRRREQRRETAFLVTVGAGGVLLSTLPSLGGEGLGPWVALRDSIPGIAQIRSLWRASVLTQIAVVLFAAQGLHALLRAKPPANPSWPGWPHVRVSLAIILAVLAVAELWPRGQRFAETPDLAAWRPWFAWLDAYVGKQEPLVHLPFPASDRVADFEETARWMILQTEHGRPLINGYSSYFPKTYNAFVGALRGCPAADRYALLRELGFRAVVVRSSWLREHPECAPPDGWTRRFRAEELDVEVHEPPPGRG